MANSRRVTFQRKTQKTVKGRQVDTWAPFYTAWSDFPAASMREQEAAQNLQLVDAITLEVRTCKKVEQMRKSLKDYRVEDRGLIYDLKSADYSRQHEGFIRLLASRTD